jgi:hypothetical protein
LTPVSIQVEGLSTGVIHTSIRQMEHRMVSICGVWDVHLAVRAM